MDERKASGEEGTRIGAYRLESRLGRGGMGEVFLAWDDRLKRRVALKRIRHDSDVTPQHRERFRREAQAAASLSHPSIVQIYDIAEDGSGDCIVMEYVEGCTLAALLGSGPLGPRLAARLAREIAEGLEAAHTAGFVHRDLKAENVIVTSSGRAKILDFGLAKPIGPSEGDSLTADGAVLGTYHAMSPEQARGGAVDARSDLFSLGVLLYEMLTGTSPFRGTSPLDTLQRVTTDRPRPVRTLRPDVPDALSALVEHLLAKVPEGRPRDAHAVALELGRIERLPELETDSQPETALDPHPGAWSDLPTGERPGPSGPPRAAPPTVETPRGASPAAAPFLPGNPYGAAGASGGDAPRGVSTVGRIGRGGTLLAAGLLIALGLVVFLLLRPPAAPLRVVVLKPAASPADDARLRLAASSVLVAELSSLASLEGIAPLDPSQVDDALKTPVEIARLAAADEVLSAGLEKDGEMARVSLRRIQGADGRVLWSRSFSVSTEARDLRQLAGAVQLQLRQAYADHSLREGTPELEARDEDYAAFVEVKSRVDSDLPLETALQRLEAIVRRSPRFLDAQLLAAGVARSLFISTREAAFRDRASAFAGQAQALSPNDPRPKREQFLLALADDQPERAAAILTSLERQLPGDPEMLVLRAQLAGQQGKTEEALADLQSAVRLTPSWRNLYHLARLEAGAGKLDDARRHLQAVLQQSPRNFWGLTELADLELGFGDLRRAEELYLRLLAVKPRRSTWTNLGLTRFLLGRYREATAAYRKALELDPGNPTVLLNLADAELALGRRPEAEALYREMIERLERDASASDPESQVMLAKAQGLVHLGKTREAVQLTQQALQRNPRDADVLYQASLVYAIAGDRASALVNAQAALEKGYQRRWFTIPTFGPLANDPELRALLAQPPVPTGS